MYIKWCCCACTCCEGDAGAKSGQQALQNVVIGQTHEEFAPVDKGVVGVVTKQPGVRSVEVDEGGEHVASLKVESPVVNGEDYLNGREANVAVPAGNQEEQPQLQPQPKEAVGNQRMQDIVQYHQPQPPPTVTNTNTTSASGGITINGNVLTLDGREIDFDEASEYELQQISTGLESGILGMQGGILSMSNGIQTMSYSEQQSKAGIAGMQAGILGMEAGIMSFKYFEEKVRNARNARPTMKIRDFTEVDRQLDDVKARINEYLEPKRSGGVESKKDELLRMILREMEKQSNEPPRVNKREVSENERELHTLVNEYTALTRGVAQGNRLPPLTIRDVTGEQNNSRPKFNASNLQPTLELVPTIYQDPKDYETLDAFEAERPSRDDRYIISFDECSTMRNYYYFHLAKPKKKLRRSLTPSELLKIASLDSQELFQGECLRWHNYYRARHGVPPLVVSEHLNQVARDWAEHLALKKAFYHRPNNKFGENLYKGPMCYTHALIATKAWYDEIDLYDYDNPGFSKETGHFTALIWRDTREIGTAFAVVGGTTTVVCNYHPPGNVSGRFNDTYAPRPLYR